MKNNTSEDSINKFNNIIMKRQRSFSTEDIPRTAPTVLVQLMPNELLLRILNPIPARLVNKFFAKEFQQNLIQAVGQIRFPLFRLPLNGVFVGCILPQHIKLVSHHYPKYSNQYRTFKKLYPNAGIHELTAIICRLNFHSIKIEF